MGFAGLWNKECDSESLRQCWSWHCWELRAGPAGDMIPRQGPDLQTPPLPCASQGPIPPKKIPECPSGLSPRARGQGKREKAMWSRVREQGRKCAKDSWQSYAGHICLSSRCLCTSCPAWGLHSPRVWLCFGLSAIDEETRHQ